MFYDTLWIQLCKVFQENVPQENVPPTPIQNTQSMYKQTNNKDFTEYQRLNISHTNSFVAQTWDIFNMAALMNFIICEMIYNKFYTAISVYLSRLYNVRC